MHPDNHMHHRHELVLFSKTNPRALTNLIPEPMAKLVKNLWDSEDQSLLKYTEKELFAELCRRGKPPMPIDTRLRLQFWFEYDRLQMVPRQSYNSPAKMAMEYVIGFVIPKETFYKHYITDPHRLAWLLCPPLNYVAMMEDVLHFSLDRIRVILEAKHIKPNGELDHAFLNYVMNIYKSMHDRLKPNSFGGATKTKSGDDGPETDPDVIAADRKRKLEEYRKLVAQQQPMEPKIDE